MLNKKRNPLQRLLALLCSGAMLFSMMPTQVIAEEFNQETEKQVSEPVEQTAPAENEPATQQQPSAPIVTEPVEVNQPAAVAQTALAESQPEVKQNAPAAVQNTPTGSEPQAAPLADPVSDIVLEASVLTLNKGETEELTATVTTDTTTEAVTWQSSESTVATVVASSSDDKTATVTAVGAGQATITATCGTASASCTVTVKSPASKVEISADGVAENDTFTVSPEQNTIQMKADTVPAAEYCTDSVVWSVSNAGGVSIDETTGLLTVTGLTNETETVTVTAKAGDFTDTYSFTLAKTQDAITFTDTTFTYGQADMTLNATAASGSEITYTIDESQENTAGATVSGNLVNVTDVGNFTVKAVSGGDGFYKSGEATQKYEVKQKPLDVVFTAPEQTITKTSNGDTTLTTGNKAALQGAFALKAGQVVENDIVTLMVDVTNAVFDAAAVGPRTINLSNVTFTLTGTDAEKYTLNTTSGNGTCDAEITAVEATEPNPDLTATGDAVELMSGAVKIEAGKQGVESGSYWYGKNGVPVTLASGYALYAVAENGSASASATTDVDGVTYLTVEPDGQFYICDDKGVYHGPYTLTYNQDVTAPKIDLNKVTADDSEVSGDGIIFGKKAEYTITVSDDESGVDPNAVYYAIADAEPDLTDASAWTPVSVNANGDGSYTFTVNAPEAGKVFVKAADQVANGGTREFCALVLEENEPTLAVSETVNGTSTQLTDGGEAADFKNEYALTIDVAEPDGTGNRQSGIQKVTYSLKESGGESVVSDKTLFEKDVPESLDAISGEYLEKEITKNLTDLVEDSLNGEYTLTLTATDFCGNSGEFTYTFKMDTTAPTISVAMAGAQNADGNYYYKADNCGITVTFADEHLDSTTCTATLVNKDGTVVANGSPVTTADGKVEITFAVEQVQALGDGTITVQASASDTAGNSQSNFDSENSKGVAVANDSASFVLDTTAPVLTGVTSEGGNYIAADQKVYFNTDFNVTFTVNEANYDSARVLNNTKQENDGPEATLSADDPSNIKLSVAGTAENAVYTLAISVEDKAGNQLVADTNLSLTGQQAVTVDGGVVTMATRFVLDTTAPQLVEVTSTTQGNDYPEGVYYKDAFDATFVIDEPNYNADDFAVDVAIEGDAASQPEVSDTQENGRLTKTVSVAKENTEKTSYVISLTGKDKAGNPIDVAQGCTTEGPNQITKTESNLVLKTRIMDTVAPVFTLTIPPVADPSISVDENNRAYYNTDISATFEVNDANLDGKKIKTAMDANTGTDFNYEEADVTWDAVGQSMSDSEKVETILTKEWTAADDGVYRFQICGEDRAGNALVQSDAEKAKTGYQATIAEQNGFWTNVKVRDTRPPQLTVALSDSEVFYQAQLGEAQEGNATSSYYSIQTNEPYRSASSASGTLTKSDCSPTSIAYQINSTTNSQSQTGSSFDYADLSLSFSGEQIFFFETLEIRDRAGNKSVMPGNTNKLYLDATAPNVDELAPTISVVAQASGEGRGTAGTDLFSSNVTVRATVTDPGEGVRSSGLYHVYYKVLVNDQDWTDKVGVSGKGSVVQTGTIGYGTSGSDYTSLEGKDEQITSQDVIDFAFDANTFNYNDVKIYVWAEDNSGNLLAESQAAHYFFGIDITAPTIRVSYDNNDAQNEKYFKDDRIATVVVTERNFDPSNTVITTETSAISDWTYAAGSMPNGDDDTWTCQVSYTEDGDYTFDVTTTDLVGHKAESVDYGDSVAPREFTVDKTAPVINITFNNNDVRNGKYYNETRTATVSIEEHNFSADGATVTTTANIQEGAVAAPAASGWSQNGDMNTATVPFTQDGNYTMHVEFIDLAGNEAEPEDVDEFVVDTTAPELEITGVEDHMAYNGDVAPVITYHDINYDASSAGVSIQGVKHPEGENLVGARTEDAFGGSFTCENIEPVKENDDVYTATGSVSDMAGNETTVDVVFSVNRFGSNYMIAEDTQQLLDNYYTNTPQDLHVIEINVDSQVTNRVTTSLNGEVTTLQEGTDYTVQESVPGWHEFDYTIQAANFTTEGAYDVTLYSEDEAGNTSSNRAIKEDDGATSDLPINFVVDMTPPVNVVTGVEENEQYIAAERTIVVNYDDNIGMNGLTLYVNDEVVAEYNADDLQNAGGSIQYVAQAENRWQQFKVVSNDLAGNVSEESTVRYLLTGNLLVQYYNNKPIFYGSLAILAALIIFIIIFIKRKKNQPVNKA